MKKWLDYMDSWSIVSQKHSLGGDGGDSLNRTCALLVLETLQIGKAPRLRVAEALNVLRCQDLGKYRRSWHPGKWYSNCDRTSRDQLIPLVILCGLIEDKSHLRDIFKDHFKRGLLFAYNTRRNFQYPTQEEHLEKSTPDVKWNYSWKLPDITGPAFWALYIRGFNLCYLRPLLELLDLEILFGAVILRFQEKRDDVINHALILEYSKVRLDTFVSKLARLVTSKLFLQSKLDRFFSKEIEPPINEMYRRLTL